MDNSVRLGTNPIAWSNDDMRELGGATSLDTCLGEARTAGFEGIELGHKFPRDADALRPVLARHNMALISGWYSSELLTRSVGDEIANLEPHLSLLDAMGCKVVVWAETSGCIHGNKNASLSSRPVLTDDQWPEFARRLSAVAAHVRSRGLWLVYHHHMGTVVETEAEVDKLMALTSDDVGLLLDTGHLTFAGGDPLSAARRHAARIRHVHCKDIRMSVMQRALDADSSFLDAVVDGVFTVPSDGDVDFVPVLKAVADAGYCGWLVVEAEQDPEKANPFDYACIGFKALAQYAREAGLL
ncbi:MULTISPECIES: myo-inosose-2 dehydratase [Kordiimonas]|jgi:inosose dehydratase|uniref:myo-inosose-2 dehydratase n=1 Tax=Kordiimonas TaxID=288021 RepID=UPI00257F0870|nr:myo-inosose-2 dehydratase [Kordiimonas sp. UBA4487]